MRRPRIAAIAAGAAVAAVTVVLLSACGGQPAGPAMSPAAPKGGGSMFSIDSLAFESGGLIPGEYAMPGAGGNNVSIPYEWRNVPAGTKSLALALVDRAPIAHDWVHWLAIDIPPTSTALARGASGASMPIGSRELDNSFGAGGYGGPQPPPGSGRHEYEATLYALDVPSLQLPQRTSLAAFERAISGHVLGSAQASGVFGR